MSEPVPTTMKAAVLNQFGGAEALALREIPVPKLAPDEVLLRVEVAGIGQWDPFEREGGYAQLLGLTPSFPYVLGSEGAGVVAAVGSEVRDLGVGDRVFASGFLNPKGGFYAEYAAVKADVVRPIPQGMSTEHAGVMSGVGLTALRGLEDTLALRPNDSLAIVGASGGVGHLAVQLAKRLGAQVLAVASGEDGKALVGRLGADAVVDGHTEDVAAATRAFASEGLDAVLLCAGGDTARQLVAAVRKGGRVAYPNGVQPLPEAPPGVTLRDFNGDPDGDILGRLVALIEQGPRLEVHIAQTFPLAEAAAAHRALERHYLGKLALRVSWPAFVPSPSRSTSRCVTSPPSSEADTKESFGCPSGSRAGPFVTCPSSANRESWHGHSQPSFARSTVQPLCVHSEVTAA